MKYEVISGDRATGEHQTQIGRFDAPEQAEAEMRRRQALEPGRAFYCFQIVSAHTRILTHHTL